MADIIKPSNTSEDYRMLETFEDGGDEGAKVLVSLLGTVRDMADKGNKVDHSSSIIGSTIDKITFDIRTHRGVYYLDIDVVINDGSSTSTKTGTITIS